MAGRRKGKRVLHPDGSVTVHGRNANGLGSIYQTSDGRWVATWREPGRKNPRKATGKTSEEAIRKREERMGQPLGGDELTVAKLAEWWLHHVYKQQVSVDTWQKAEERLPRIEETLGNVPIKELDYATIVEWQSRLLTELKPSTVKNYRQTLALMLDEAVKLGRLQGNPARTVKAPSSKTGTKPVYTTAEVELLLGAAREHRLGAAVAILFLQGWRVSETLGLAWDDIDFETGRVQLQRISVYRRGTGQILKPWAKSDGAHGEHWLAPTVISFLEERRVKQAAARAAAPVWEAATMDGRPVDLVFTNGTGGLVLRQHIEKAVVWCAKKVGLDPAGLATHGGRRSVITALWSEGDESLEDIAGFVGHADEATTKHYVKRLGKRPKNVAQRAAALLDPAAD